MSLRVSFSCHSNGYHYFIYIPNDIALMALRGDYALVEAPRLDGFYSSREADTNEAVVVS